MDITRIDSNFSTQPADENGFLFRDVKLPPFSIEGLAWYKENGQAYYRIPKTMRSPAGMVIASSVLLLVDGVLVREREVK